MTSIGQMAATSVTIVFLLTAYTSVLCSRDLSEEERLLEQLFIEYNPSARPVMNSSKTVYVSIEFSLMHIKELDVRSQVLTTTGLLILKWTDERLQWDPIEYGNMTEMIVEAGRLWRPEFAVINGAEKIYENYNNFRAIVSSLGDIRWEPGGVFKTMCQIDITYYPFDEQICELMFGAWSYHTSKMNLTNASMEINLDSYKINGEWEIGITRVKRDEFFYECCPHERFAYIAFEVFMRRRHTFYIMNVILPSILTSVLLLSIFFCTPGQKVQIGVVVLLSFRIFLLNVAGNIPKTSDHIPLLGIYLTCTMAITTLSMVLTVFILNLHHITDRPVPLWTRRLVLVYFAKILGFCAPSTENKPRSRRQQHDQGHGHINPHFRRASLRINGEGDSKTAVLEIHSGLSNDEPSGSGTLTQHKQNPDEEYGDEVNALYAKDWKRVAEVLDRLFFWLFLMAILISTLVLFHPLSDSYLKRIIRK